MWGMNLRKIIIFHVILNSDNTSYIEQNEDLLKIENEQMLEEKIIGKLMSYNSVYTFDLWSNWWRPCPINERDNFNFQKWKNAFTGLIINMLIHIIIIHIIYIVGNENAKRFYFFVDKSIVLKVKNVCFPYLNESNEIYLLNQTKNCALNLQTNLGTVSLCCNPNFMPLLFLIITRWYDNWRVFSRWWHE